MKTVIENKVVAAYGSLRRAVIALLEENGLPISDIDDGKTLFALIQNGEVIGTGGLEFFNNCALLRSLSVKRGYQKTGLGKLISCRLEQICKENGIVQIYLLTETAEDFFNKQGYKVIDRASAPVSIKNSSEFTTVCSTAGILMHKSI